MKNYKKIMTIFLTLIITISCNSKQDNDKTFHKQKQVNQEKIFKNITIAQFGHVFVYLPIYIAKHKGFFKKNGLNVKYISTGGDEKTWAAVTSGSAQFGVADPTFVAIAREKGDNSGKIIAIIINGVPFWGVSKKNLRIEKIKDFNGLRIATYPAPSTNYALMDRLIKKYNLNSRIIQGAYGSLLSLIENNKADVAMVLEPTVSLSVIKLKYNVVFSYKNIYKNFALTGLSTTKEFIKKHPDICQKVVDALQESYNFMYNNFEETVKLAKKEFPDVSENIIKLAVKRMLEDGTVPRSVVVKKEAWDEAIKLRKFIGDLKNDAPFDINVDNRFAIKAVAEKNEK